MREGWDNPNVFQICALRDVRTERERRQTIGRGLRLCVNRHGERVRGFDINTLTVVARESYEEFAEQLQREIEEETRIRFGIVERHQFARIPVTDDDGTTSALGFAASQELWQHLHGADYIDAQGRIQDSLREALKDDSFTPPERFATQRAEIAEVLRTLAGRLDIKNADERKRVRPAPGGSPRRRVQGTVGPHQAQEHLPGSVRQRRTDRAVHPGASGCAADSPDAAAVAQGRHRHRPGRRTGHKVYAKLPGWFAVPTPLGAYRSDWAVLVDTNVGTRLYLVVETKGSLYADDLRLTEDAKIKCGRAHFAALEVRDPPARYEVATSVEALLAGIGTG